MSRRSCLPPPCPPPSPPPRTRAPLSLPARLPDTPRGFQRPNPSDRHTNTTIPANKNRNNTRATTDSWKPQPRVWMCLPHHAPYPPPRLPCGWRGALGAGAIVHSDEPNACAGSTRCPAALSPHPTPLVVAVEPPCPCCP